MSRIGLVLATTAAMTSVDFVNVNTGPIDTSEVLRNYRPPIKKGRYPNLMSHPCGSRKARKARKGGKP